MPWAVLGNLANVQAITGVFVGGVTTAAVQKYAPNTDMLLESCRQELEDVKARLNEIPHARRERICAAAEQGQCKSLEKLEQDLIQLSDDRWDLNERSDSSSLWQRRLPMTQLREDIKTLNDGIRRLRIDTCNTTNTASARFPSQAPPQRPTAGSSAWSSSSLPQTSATGGSPSTQDRTFAGQQPSGQNEYPLQTITHPPLAHTREGREPIPLPIDIV